MESRSKRLLPGQFARVRFLALAALLTLCVSACSAPPESEPEVFQEPVGGWVETWRDDFDGPTGSAPDVTKWRVDVRPSGQNKELDYDTDDRKNSFLDGNGNLVFQAIQESYVDAQGVTSTQPYTSARLDTRGKLEQTYGRFEARIKLPPGGQGIWPAFWLLGSDIDEAGWPGCGEVDILEMRGSEPARILSSLHGPNYSGSGSYNNPFQLPSGTFGDDFHTFTFEWTPDAVRWLIDGKPYFIVVASSLAKRGRHWVFDHPFFIILNLAVGGVFDGSPAATTLFPQQMLVDYVSVSEIASP
ncbi:MAG TPA: glycoside hydrolase family 16 protein [Polyangiaceae bacterium]|nr:glycoside hydrolase family 16 protein [Polyangiaceae bacterium]